MPQWLIIGIASGLAVVVLSRKRPLRWRWPIAAGIWAVAILLPVAIDYLDAPPSPPFDEDDLTPVPLDGYVAVPDSGYALTLPQGWSYVHPSAQDEDALLDVVRYVDAELAGMMESDPLGVPAFSLMALEPLGAGSVIRANCNISEEPTYGLAFDWHVDATVAATESLWDRLVAEPRVTGVELPAGDAARIDLTWRNPDLPDTEQSAYLISDGTTLHTLTCADSSRPADHWLSIAETFEFLEAPAAPSPSSPIEGPALGPVASGGRLEVPSAGIALEVPEGWYALDLQHPELDDQLASFDATTPLLAQVLEFSRSLELTDVFEDADPAISDAMPTFWDSVAVVAYAPIDGPTAGESCNVSVREVTQSLDEIIEEFREHQQELNEALGRTGTWTIDPIALPAGEAWRLEYSPGPDDAWVLAEDQFLLVDDGREYSLSCSYDLAQRDVWLAIAESIEFIPTEA